MPDGAVVAAGAFDELLPPPELHAVMRLVARRMMAAVRKLRHEIRLILGSDIGLSSINLDVVGNT